MSDRRDYVTHPMTDTSEPRTEAERDLCDVLYHSEFHISREQAEISGRLMYDAMLARGYRIEAAASRPAALDVERLYEALWSERDRLDAGVSGFNEVLYRRAARAIATEYARLASEAK